MSVSVLLCAMRGADAAGGTGSVHIPRDATGDVEAAAVTLGAVTVGGLVMRAVLASRRDEDKEREKLAVECARLEEEEILRARRLKRKAMERVDEADALPEDDALQSSLLKRLQDIDAGDAPTDDDKKFMRNSPIPDRATGSMLLDRPTDDDAKRGDPAPSADEDDEAPVNADELEMLNRMWNLNAGDSEERSS